MTNEHVCLPSRGSLTLRPAVGRSVRLAALGDLSLHGRVAEAIEQDGPEVVFGGVLDELSTADIRVGNLETVITRSLDLPPSPKARHVAAEGVVQALVHGGVDVLTFANNHIADAGSAGILDTIDIVRSAGLSLVGAGGDRNEARRPLVVDTDGPRLAFLAYSYGMGQIAGPGRAGCNEDITERVIEDLDRSELADTIRVVCLHADAEFEATPAPSRVASCRRLVEAGASLVLCHHPHVPQGIEAWKAGVIAYSLGNYVSPISAYMAHGSEYCDRSFHLFVGVDEAGVHSVELGAVRIDDRGCPFLPTSEERREILDLVGELSAMLADDSLLDRRYRDMVRRWSRSTARAVVWSARKADLGTARLVIEDLLRTPTKRRWLRDAVASMLRPGGAS